MSTAHTAQTPAAAIAALKHKSGSLAPGLLLCATLGAAAYTLQNQFGGPVMLYALVLGLCVNAAAAHDRYSAGVHSATQSILRLGIVLLGARITVADAAQLGIEMLLFALAGVTFTVTFGTIIGRALKLPLHHAMICAGAVAICGASAALAIAAALPKHKTSGSQTCTTIVIVTALSTAAMLTYPLLAQALDMSENMAGLFIGATIHDVAQVVGAGYSVSETAGDTATLMKLTRISCLAPAVVCITLYARSRSIDGQPAGASRPPLLPLFLIGFLGLMVLNSLGVLSSTIASIGNALSQGCLIIAMVGIGLKTPIKALLSCGVRPVAALILQSAALAVFVLIGLHTISHGP